MKLRPYQRQATAHALQMLEERKNSLIVAGTGAGKTIMMAAVIGDFYRGFCAVNKRRPHILVLVHRTEIHSQNHSKFSLVNPDIATSEITAVRKSLHGNVHFGMVQTVANIFPELERANSYFDLIVIDEAHHSAASTYEDIIFKNSLGNPNAALLGVTATPNRGDKMPLIHLFDNYYQITTKFLIESHYLVRPIFLDFSPTFQTDKGIEVGHLAKNCRNDDKGMVLIDKLVDDYLKAKQPGKSVIFAPNHEFCKRIVERLRNLGRDVSYLGPGIDDLTRQAEIMRFEKGNCEELVNVDICTEGYDYPELRNLVDFDTNGTHGQWVQKVGRVLRTAPNKTSCTVIDFGGNVQLYPEGVEAEVDLNGAIKNPKGQHITEDEMFSRMYDEEKFTSSVVYQEDDMITPYHLPEGFESVNDSELGIVFVACCPKKDCIIVPRGDDYILLQGDKLTIKQSFIGNFKECIKSAQCFLGQERFKNTDRPISNLQIKMLAPEYPTLTLDWNGANCCICWKVWRNDILKVIQND